MLSDVTISFADRSVTFPGLYVLIGCLIVLGLAGFIVAMASTRRIERKTSEATDILVVQLERIGDSLDRLVSQTAARAANEAVRPRASMMPDWPVPGRVMPPPPARATPESSPLERAAQMSAQDQPAAPASTAAEKKPAQEQPVESNVSEAARSLVISMLGR